MGSESTNCFSVSILISCACFIWWWLEQRIVKITITILTFFVHICWLVVLIYLSVIDLVFWIVYVQVATKFFYSKIVGVSAWVILIFELINLFSSESIGQFSSIKFPFCYPYQPLIFCFFWSASLWSESLCFLHLIFPLMKTIKDKVPRSTLMHYQGVGCLVCSSEISYSWYKRPGIQFVEYAEYYF